MTDVKDLLLAPKLEREHVAALLRPYGIRDPQKADGNLQQIAGEPAERELLAEILGQVLSSVSQSANPDQALTYFERFASAALNKTRLFSHLKDSPEAMDILAKTLGGSPYMSEILIRDPHHFYWLTDPEILHSPRRKREIRREIARTLRVVRDEGSRLDYLRIVKRREMLHLGVRDLLRLCSVEQTLTALSVLAEVLIEAAAWICASELKREYGIPAKAFSGFTVLAMGKLGGGELNFSSDVDLVYLYAADSEASGSIIASDYFPKLCQRITKALSELTGEGYLYRVDLRLRPEGKSGHIAYSLEGFRRYYESRLATWERLALIKVWPVAGSRALAAAYLSMVEPFIYDLPFDVRAIEDLRGMKSRIDQQMVIRDQSNRNVKLGTGGIREIELIVQSLQISRGRGLPAIRNRGTLSALAALARCSLVSDDECEKLTQAYIFLRDVENKLQMVHDTQTHSIPIEPEELATSARLLGYTDTEQFLRDFQTHTGQVNAIFRNHIERLMRSAQ